MLITYLRNFILIVKVCLILLSIFPVVTSADIGDFLIDGNISFNNGHPVMFTHEDFDRMPHSVITTKTPWTDVGKAQEFSGVSLSYILRKVGANGGVLKVHALNDYAIDIPMDDVARFNILVADKMNGSRLDVRTFGPYFIIYPLDDNRDELNSPKYLSRFVWQVDRITVSK